MKNEKTQKNMKKSIGIGLMGYGSIGKVHTLCYKELGMLYPQSLAPLKLIAVCTRSSNSAKRAQLEGVFTKSYDSFDTMLENPDIDVVDCSLPNFLRLKAIRKAVKHKKHIYCEKPLACNLEDAMKIARILKSSKQCFGMTFNFRFVPAVQRAMELLTSGELGEVYHFNAKYYHTGYQDASRPLSWRLSHAKSGGGALVDMGSHIIDLMQILVGNFVELSARTHTWVKERPLMKGSIHTGTVDVDDAAWLQVKTENGARGTLETSRFATGTLDDLVFDIYASKGSVHFNLMDANWLYYFDERSPSGSMGGKRGWTRIETVQHYPGSATPPPRSILGWTRTHAENQYRFLSAVQNNTEPSPSLEDGLSVQRVLEASYKSANHNGDVIRISEL